MRGGARFMAVALALVAVGVVLWFAFGGDPAVPPSLPPGPNGQGNAHTLPADLDQDSGEAEDRGDGPVVVTVDDIPIPADAVPVHGRVIDTTGRPIEGARLRALAATTGLEAMNFLKLIEQVQDPIVALDDTTSDAAGEFTLRRVRPGMVRILAEADTFAPRYTEPLPVARGRDGLLEIVLSPGYPLSGTVTLESGEPVPDVEIAVFPNPRGDMPFIEKTTTMTGEDGSYSFSALPPGRLTGFVRPPNRPVQILDRLRIPEQSTADVVLKGNCGLRLLVKNEAGDPVAGASVTVVGRRPAQTFTFTKTGNDGVVALESLGEGKLEMVAVMHPEYLPFPDRIWNPGKDMQDLELVPGETKESTVTLRSGIVLHGRTVDAASGDPVPGAFVRAVSSDMDLMFGGDGVRSDAEGKFRLPALRTGRSLLLADAVTHSMPPGIKRALRSKETPEGLGPFVLELEEGVAPTEVTLPLHRNGTLRGRVVSPEGQPVPAATVSITDFDPDRLMDQSPSYVTDSGGRFTIDDFAPGFECTLSATADGWMKGEIESITLEAGATLDDVEIVLTSGHELAGEVVDASGVPLADALVQVAPEGRRNSLNLGRSDSPPARTDAEGRFVMRAIPEGRMAVRAEREGFVPSTEVTEVVAGQRAQVRVTLKRDAPISGRVVDESGAAVSSAWVRAQSGEKVMGSGGGHSGRTNTVADGTFTIEGLPANATFDVTAGANGFVNAPAVSVTSGTSGVEIRLQRGLEISGRVLDPAGRGLAGMRVRIHPKERAGGRESVKTNDQGGFSVRGLEPGPHSVRVYGPQNGDFILNEDHTVEAGELGVTVNLREGLRIDGRLVDSNGKPVVGASVNASRIDEGQPSSSHHSNSNKSGEFALRGMPEGNYRVIVSHRGSQAQRLESVKAGTSDLVITMSEGMALAGVVIGRDGKPLANARVIVRGVPPLRFYRSARSGSDGTFRITGLEQGKYRVEARSGGRGPRPAPSGGQDSGIEVQAGDEAIRIAVE
ncbi:MAG: carboxypeptidase regulatory-like domain-containing protein [Planctomycetota bacterium]